MLECENHLAAFGFVGGKQKFAPPPRRKVFVQLEEFCRLVEAGVRGTLNEVAIIPNSNAARAELSETLLLCP